MTLIEFVVFFLYLADKLLLIMSMKIHGKLISQSEMMYFLEVLNASKSLPVSIPD